MKRTTRLLSVVSALLALLLAVSTQAADNDSGVGPYIPEAVKGEQCVRDTDDMRRNHMKYLLKHRKEALREGIRTKQFSLKECLSCHVPAKAAAQPAGHEGDHFCKNCHAYVGVSLDCFECHNSQPGKQAANKQPNQLAATENNTGAMQ